MRVLVTGATGFIGQHLVSALLKLGYEVHVIQRSDSHSKELLGVPVFIDHGTTDALLEYMKKEKFAGVIHLASCFIVEHEINQIETLIISNILFSTRVLEVAARTSVKWFINTGTFWQHYNNSEYSPVNLYAATKQAFEVIAQYYIEAFNINFVTLKLNDTYGPGDKRKKIFTLWKEVASTGLPMKMSKGEQLIDIVYIDDVMNAYLKLIEQLNQDVENNFKGKCFAVSSYKPITLKMLAEIYAAVSGRAPNILWGEIPYRKREVMVPWNQGVPVPGWAPKISIEEGIRRFLQETQ